MGYMKARYLLYLFILLTVFSFILYGYRNYIKTKEETPLVNSDNQAYELFPETTYPESSNTQSVRLKEKPKSVSFKNETESANYTLDTTEPIKSDSVAIDSDRNLKDAEKMRSIADIFTKIGDLNFQLGTVDSYIIYSDDTQIYSEVSKDITSLSSEAYGIAQTCPNQECISLYWDFVSEFEEEGLIAR